MLQIINCVSMEQGEGEVNAGGGDRPSRLQTDLSLLRSRSAAKSMKARVLSGSKP